MMLCLWRAGAFDPLKSSAGYDDFTDFLHFLHGSPKEFTQDAIDVLKGVGPFNYLQV